MVIGFEYALQRREAGEKLSSPLPGLVDWIFTEAETIILALSAAQPTGDGSGWDEYTFWVRAIDDDGGTDESPACVNFTTTTVSPTVQLLRPLHIPPDCFITSTSVYLRWTATDPDGDARTMHTRWALLPIDDREECWTASEYTQQQPLANLSNDDARWSPWEPYGAEQGFTELALHDLAPGQGYFIVVQARDGAQSVSPQLHWGSQVLHIRPTDEVRLPILFAVSPQLGRHAFAGTSGSFESAGIAGTPLSMRWIGEADEYASTIVAWRYGVDVVDPQDPHDPGWRSGWTDDESNLELELNWGSNGQHTLLLEILDLAGTVSSATFVLSSLVIPPVAQRQPILVVFNQRIDYPTLYANALATWIGLVEEAVNDRVSLHETKSLGLPTMAELVGYRAVMWIGGSTDAAVYGDWRDPEPPLAAFQRFAGNVLLTGAGVLRLQFLRSHALADVPVELSPTCPPQIEPEELGCVESPWLWHDWGILVVDQVRPLRIVGEHQSGVRSLACDGLFAAIAKGAWPDLFPTVERIALSPGHPFRMEEAYNTWLTLTRHAPVDWPTDIEAIYEFQSRAGAGAVEPSACELDGHWRPLDGAPIGLRVSTHSEMKPRPGSADYVMGIDLASFERPGVLALLRMIFEDWGLVR